MPEQFFWEMAARDDLRKIEKAIALHILRVLARYAVTKQGDVKQLKNSDPPEYRLRVGEYRVRFEFRGTLIAILAVKHRREAYR